MTPAMLGKYVVRHELGHGGMGTVYEAWDSELQRRVAVKVLRGAHRDAEERFRREARLVAALRHPNIVTIHDFGHESGAPFIVMELLEGVTVADDIRAGALRAPASKVRAMADVCLALHRAHQAGAVHRDVKPANIHLGNDGVTRLLDFGVAHLIGSALTQPLDLIGTPAYLSPEVVAGRPVDRRSDVYSVAATLYEWLTLERPHRAPDVRALIWKVLNEDATPLDQRWPGCPPELARVVQQGLARDPSHRYQDAQQLGTALLAALHAAEGRVDEPVGGQTRSTMLLAGARHRRGGGSWPSRRRTLAVLALAAGTVALGTWMAVDHLSREKAPAVPVRAKAPPVASVEVPRPSASQRRDVLAAPDQPREPVTVPASGRRGTQLTSEPRRETKEPATKVPPDTGDPELAQVDDVGLPEAPVIPVGTTLLVRIVNELRTDRSRVGDTFAGELQEPIRLRQGSLVPVATKVQGRVDVVGSGDAEPSLEVSLVGLSIEGRTVPIRTARYRIAGPPAGGGKASTLIVGVAAGAIVGAVAGGRDGAVVGAAAGAAVAANASRDPPSSVYVLGDRIPFKLAKAVPLQTP